ncbi:MAG: hypothetical protein FWC55_02480 [Firmicutes bacterium]|nr:hypothetical protein [Bacillota bacterium]
MDIDCDITREAALGGLGFTETEYPARKYREGSRKAAARGFPPIRELLRRVSAGLAGRRGSGVLPAVRTEFAPFLREVGPDDPGCEGVLQAVSLCGAALDAARRRIALSGDIAEKKRSLAEIESFEALGEEEARRLEELLARFMSLSEERAQLLERLTEFDNSVAEMPALENDAGPACPRIADAERSGRALRRDMAYLGSERAELEREKQNLEKGLRAARWLTAGLISVFATTAAALAYLGAQLQRDVFAASSVTVILAAVASAMLYAFQRHIARETRLNAKKRRRAVAMLNRKSVLYAHYANYLNFSYKKYRVRSSRMLRENLDGLARYRQVAGRVDAVRRIMYETQEEIERFLREKRLGGLRSTIEEFAGAAGVGDKRRRCAELRAEIGRAESELLRIDRRQAEIWELLTELRAADESRGRTVAKVMDKYMDLQ